MNPERLDQFIARANALYYATHDPFADFTTAPEVSQVFGELIGAWLACAWQLAGAPDPVLLVEAGPGRGTLMADILRTIRAIMPACAAALQVHLIETSARLRAAQASRVPNATWHADLETLPNGPVLLVANEFLDALPIRQFVRRGSAWMERYVAGDRFVEQPADAPALPAAQDGQIRELNEAARQFVASTTDRILRHGGTALFVDYGRARSGTGESLQAIADGRPVHPLSPPGSADLTAHVDFADLALVAHSAGARVCGPVTQGTFLRRLGLVERSRILAARRPEQADSARRLVDPQQMGLLFKVMALTRPNGADLPGLDPDDALEPTE